MSHKPSDILFQLIHSLEKAEKRHFKLYIKRSSANENLNIVQLFDAMDKMKSYNGAELLKKLPQVQKDQLHNLKKHLYKQILSSLRLLKSADSVDLQLNELFDHAHILYKKGLFYQSLRMLDKAKDTARANQKFYFLPLALGLEKRIETQNITEHIMDRAVRLADESGMVSKQIDIITRLSNLALQLYSWHVKQGPVRTAGEAAALAQLMHHGLPRQQHTDPGFYEQLYLYQSHTWHALLQYDALKSYRYAHKWVRLFHTFPQMKRVETSHYIKGLHYLLNAHFELLNYHPFLHTLAELEAFAQTPRVQDNDNFRVQTVIYLGQAGINQHFMQGTFDQGIGLVHKIEEQLQENALFIDQHRVLVLQYKMALLYFGCADYSTCIDYAQKIINDAIDLREDLQGNARLLLLLSHYEWGNSSLMDYLTRSVQRFLSKTRKLSHLETELFRFFQASPGMQRTAVRQRLTDIYEKAISEGKGGTLHGTADSFLMLWLEGKVLQQPISDTVRKKLGTRINPQKTAGMI